MIITLLNEKGCAAETKNVEDGVSVSHIKKTAFLNSHGFVLIERNPRAKPDYMGRWQVCDSCYEPESDEYCIVGNDFIDLVDTAYSYLKDMVA